VIFNPQSAGEAPQLAEKLRTDLANRLPRMSVSMNPTKRAGHARDLAREAAGVGRPLIVSVSGDGGYNEVVDGVMQADNDDVVCAVMAAGNANDHRRMTRERPLADAVVAGEIRRIDLLRLTIGSGDDARAQFAHYWNGSDPGRRGRPPEGQQGLIQGDRVDGPDLRPVPAPSPSSWRMDTGIV
jgi:diacylglycerol kinase (ATP)